ncbi:MAG TPA: (2Fe-2S) ferredoxin domain-containing protein [Candidatus Berkiella sp.]|nr:(2Fe-2S) ferredoxin domain-containing protein [Candidatus Berkiella sp.]
MYYQNHVFFCTNLRSSGKQCCATAGAEELREYAKKKLKKLGLHGAGRFRVCTSGCLGRCEEGPLLVIYPDGVWYSYKTYQDIDEIIEKHLLNGQIVSHLQLPGTSFSSEST